MPTLDLAAQAFLWFMAYSLFGWVFECVYCSIAERKPINRGFLNGPYCPIYGAGALFAVGTLSGVGNPVALFALAAVGCCVLEYLTSYVMERLFHTRWWDYSHRRFNLNGRICLAGATLFGLGCFAAVRGVQPRLAELTGQLEPAALYTLAEVLAVLFVTDIIVTCVGLAGFRAKVDAFREQMTEQAGRLKSQVSSQANGVWERLEANPLGAQARERVATVGSHVRTVSGAWLSQLTVPLRYSRAKAVELTRRTGLGLPSFEGFYRAFKETLNQQERRVLNAFPRLETARPRSLREVVRELRESMSKR